MTIESGKGGEVMGPKYNKLMDNLAFRLSLNITGFALWLAAAVTLLKLA